jgi:ABC-type lipoprotein export system ATPase subunit
MIHARKLSRHYGESSNRVTALDSIDLTIDSGSRVGILGRSGSGKTTLLNLLAGLDRPTEGSLSVADQELQKLTAIQLAQYRRETVGVIFQSFQLIPNRSAFQNVELPLILAGANTADRKRRVDEAIDRVGLTKRSRHKPSELSGGEQQRVAVARAMVSRPKVLLADEPTGNLDSKTAQSVTELMLEMVEENGSTLILITHDRHLAESCCDRIVHLLDGRLLDEHTGSTGGQA